MLCYIYPYHKCNHNTKFSNILLPFHIQANNPCTSNNTITEVQMTIFQSSPKNKTYFKCYRISILFNLFIQYRHLLQITIHCLPHNRMFSIRCFNKQSYTWLVPIFMLKYSTHAYSSPIKHFSSSSVTPQNDGSDLIANLGSSKTDDLSTNAIQSNLASWLSALQPLALPRICNRSLYLNYHCPFGTITF